MLTFKNVKLLVKGTEKRKTKADKTFTNIIVQGDDFRTMDLYYPGEITLLPDRVHEFDFSYNKTQTSTYLKVERVELAAVK